jgi:hypothetical protein
MANKIKFTHRSLLAIKPPAKDGKPVIYWDNQRTGLGMRVQPLPTGTKTLVYGCRVPGKSYRTYEIGVFPDQAPLAAAHTTVDGWQAMLRAGKSPWSEDITPEDAGIANTFASALDTFAKHHLSKRRTGDSVERSLRMELLAERKDVDGVWREDADLVRKGCGPWREKALTVIDRKEIIRIIVGVHDSGRPIQANRLLA